MLPDRYFILGIHRLQFKRSETPCKKQPSETKPTPSWVLPTAPVLHTLLLLLEDNVQD